MIGDRFEQVLAKQLTVNRTLHSLLRLVEMEQAASDPDTWEALLRCKERELDALAKADLSQLLAQCQKLLQQPERPADGRLALLIERNREMLIRLCSLEQQALRRAESQHRQLAHELASLKVNQRLDNAYGAEGSCLSHFVDQRR